MHSRWFGLMFGAVLALGAAASQAHADCDVSTDKGALAAYKQATGKDHDEKCITHSTTFPGLVTIGSFAYDRGCGGEGVLVGCSWNPKNAAKLAMAKAGWAKADAAKKQVLALAWLSEINGTDVVDSSPGPIAKGKKKWTPVAATVAKDGSLTLDFWTVAPVGMRPIHYYTRYKVLFAADGTPGTYQELDSASQPIRGANGDDL